LNKNSKKILGSIFLIIVVGVGIYILLPQLYSARQSIYVLENLKYWALMLAIVCEFGSYVGSSYLRISLLGLFDDSISLWRGILIELASASFGMVAGGMFGSSAACFQWLRNSKTKTQAAAMASSLPLLINNLAVLVISLFGVIYLLFMHELTQLQIVGFLVILVLLLLVIFVLFLIFYKREKSFPVLVKALQKIYKIIKRPFNEEHVKKQLREIFVAWDLLLSNGWKKALIGVAMIYGFDMSALFFLFVAANELIKPAVLVIGYGLPLLLGKAAFVIPGGIGIVETTMVALYEKLGTASDIAVVAVLAYRLIAFWLPSLAGFPIAFYLNHKVLENEA